MLNNMNFTILEEKSFLLLFVFISINCSPPINNDSDNQELGEFIVKKNFSSDAQLAPGFTADFNIVSSSDEQFRYRLELFTPLNNENWLYGEFSTFKDSTNKEIDIPDLICKKACDFRLTILDSETILLDTLFPVDIIPEIQEKENLYLNKDISDVFIFKNSNNAWRFGSNIDSTSIFEGYLDLRLENGLELLDFNVETADNERSLFSNLQKNYNSNLFISDYSPDVYRIDTTLYDNSYLFLQKEDIAIPFSGNIGQLFVDPVNEIFIEKIGYQNISFDGQTFIGVLFKGNNYFADFEYTFVKELGIYKFKVGHSYEDKYVLKGAVIDGIVYGDTSKTLNSN